jgi:MFS family permease
MPGRKQEMSRSESLLARRPIAASVLYTVVAVLPLYFLTAQAVRLQAELSFGKAELGLVVAAFYLVSALASKALGEIIDRRGPGYGLRAAAAFAALSGAFAAGLAGSWYTLAVATGLAGMSNAYAQLSSNLAVAAHVRDRRQGIGFALKQAAVPFGAMVAGFAVPLGTGASWRWFFAGAALAGVAALLVAPEFPPSRLEKEAPGSVWTDRPLIALAGAAFVLGGVGNTLASFVVDAAADAGFAETTSARLLVLGSFMAISVRLVVGLVADRRPGRGAAEMVTTLLVGGVGFAVLAASATDGGGSFIVGVVVGFAGAWGWPGVLYYLVIRTSTQPPAASTGVVLSAAYVGTVLIPPAMGLIAEQASYGIVFALSAVLIVAGAGAIVLSQLLFRSLSHREVPRT